jgi:hypothetical protein
MITILLAFAFVFFVIGAFWGYPGASNGPFWGRFDPVSAGLAFWVLTEILGHWPK